MNTSYSKIRHIQEVNLKLEKRLLSEQEPPNNTGYWTRTTTMDTPMSQDDKEEEQTSNSPSIEKQTSNSPSVEKQTSNSPSIDERIKSLYGEWLSQKSNNVNNDITYIGGNLERAEDMLKILQILKSKGWPLCIINGNLKLKNAISLVKKIEFIKEVNGDVIIWNTPIESLGSIEYIQGDLLIYKSNIKTLGNLVQVHGNVFINDENLRDLGMLKSVGKRFELVNCKLLKSLGNLRYIGGFLDISNTNVSSFGELKSVGSYVDISYTPLAKKYNEHMIRTMFNMKPNRRVTAKSRIIKEQTTPPVTSGTTPVTSGSTTTTVLTPQQKNAERVKKYLEAREKQKQANAARLAPIEAARKARIDNWIAGNPGKTEKDYWKWQEKRQSGPEADIYNGQLCGFGNDKPGCAGSERARERRLKRERNR
jgi:hypothetical protein